MSKYKLYRERDGKRTLIKGFDTKREAAQYVEDQDDVAWPEGYDAVLIEVTTGSEWLYTDKWEEMS